MARAADIENFNPDENVLICLKSIFDVRISEIFQFVSGIPAVKDAVHDTRIASRRLQSLFIISSDLFVACEYKKIYTELKKFIKLLSRARESEVTYELTEEYIENSSSTSKQVLKLFLLKQKESFEKEYSTIGKKKLLKNYKDLETKLKGFIEDTFSNIQVSGSKNIDTQSSFRYNARIFIPGLIERVYSYIPAILQNKENENLLHKLRIKAKPLRYTLELYQNYFGNYFRSFVKEIRNFVETAGSVHDIDVIIEELKNFIKKLNSYNEILKKYGGYLSTMPFDEFLKELTEIRNQKYIILQNYISNLNKEEITKNLQLIFSE